MSTDSVTIVVSKKVAASLMGSKKIIVIETVTPNETAMHLLSSTPGAAIVFDYGLPEITRGVLFGVDIPAEFEDKMFISLPEAREGIRVQELADAVQRYLASSEAESMPLFIVGSPITVWTNIRRANIATDQMVCLSLLSDVHRNIYANQQREDIVETIEYPAPVSGGGLHDAMSPLQYLEWPIRGLTERLLMCLWQSPEFISQSE